MCKAENQPPLTKSIPAPSRARGRSFLINLLPLVAAVLLTACNTAQVRSTRNPAAATASSFHQVMVVGMDERPEVREAFENAVVNCLQSRKLEGIASIRRFALGDFKGTKEEIRQKIQAAGVESVLMVKVGDRASFAEAAPPALGDISWGAVEETRYSRFTTPGGEIETDLLLGMRLYRVADGLMVWCGTVDKTVSEDADSIVVVRKLANAIVTRMAKDKVIP